MSAYPDLDPDLHDIVVGLNAAFPPDPENLSVADYRALLERLADGKPTDHAPGITVRDVTLNVNDRAVRIRLYRPAHWTQSDAAMLYMHGGGWMLGSIEGHDQVCTDLATQTGIAVASIDYALAPEHPYPTALNECSAAFEWLASGASPLGKVGPTWVGGDSAGGNLALALCLKHRDSRNGDQNARMPDGQLLIYPCTAPDFSRPSYTTQANAPFLTTALMHRFWEVYLAGQTPDPYAAPALAKSLQDLPKAVVLTVALDPLVDEGNAIAEALAQAGVPTKHHCAPHLIHGFLRFRSASAKGQAAFQWICDALSA